MRLAQDVTAARSLKTENRGSRTREVRSHCVFKLPFGEELFAGTDGRTTGQGYTTRGNLAADGAREKFTQNGTVEWQDKNDTWESQAKLLHSDARDLQRFFPDTALIIPPARLPISVVCQR